MSTDDYQVALSNCDKEPVHIPGFIQSFGGLFAFDMTSREIRYASENLETLLGINASTVLGMDYERWLDDREIVYAIRGALNLPSIRHQRERVGAFELFQQPLEMCLFVSGDNAVVEFEVVEPKSSQSGNSSVSIVRSMLANTQQYEGVSKLLDSCVRALRYFTGHDRVMAYRFLDDGSGEIVAEAHGPGIEAFKGLRYPASDVPAQVRQIMLRTSFRVTHDIQAAPVRILQKEGAEPLDMTLGHLRGVSPIHVEYLNNMGVRATLNVSIIVEGELWGLFAFHHHRPRKLTLDERLICELFGQLGSLLIEQEVARERQTSRHRIRSMVDALGKYESDSAAVEQNAHHLLLAMQADGLLYVHDQRPPDTESSAEGKTDGNTEALSSFEGCDCVAIGDLPDDGVVHALYSRVRKSGQILSSSKLAELRELVPGGDVRRTGGAFLLPVMTGCILGFFRNEEAQEVRWAGGPEKAISYGPNGPRLTPRESFAEYRESVRGQSRPWSQRDFDNAEAIIRQLLPLAQSKLVGQVQRNWDWERKKQRQDLLIAELNHRAKNSLALVRSIVRQTQTSSKSIEQFVESLEQRILALSSANELSSSEGLRWVSLHGIIRRELAPYEYARDQVEMDAPSICIRSNLGPIMGLLFHEMTTNAVKYGALADSNGHLAIRWYRDAGGVTIEWKEEFGDVREKPQTQGFGWNLIRRAIPHECNGEASICLEARQLVIRFWLPAADTKQTAAPEIPDLPEPDREVSVAEFQSIMVLEDNSVLAFELERVLMELGTGAVDVHANPQSAMESLDSMSYDGAVLDVELGGQTSYEVAARLMEMHVPFVFASSYRPHADAYPLEFDRIPKIEKPISRVALADALKTARADLA